jgi:hypothetical protein
VGQSTELRLRTWTRKGTLGNDRAQLLQRVPKKVKVFRLQ